jgi:glycosyltransferase involved in cell wall biosynthesis
MADAPHPDGGPGAQLAYLNSRYPAVSHTFIQREVEALRRLGVDIVPFSVRRPASAELGPGAGTEEIARTTYLLDGIVRTAAAAAWAVLRSPLAAIKSLAASQRLSPAGLTARLRHAVYALEGLLLARHLRKRALRHVHVHMANNGAMVAVLATVANPDLAYSLTIHGSAEFFDMHRLRVRVKAERAQFVRFISEAGRAQVMAFTDPRAWARFHVVRCGVDTPPLTTRQRLPAAEPALVAVGRLVPIKGHRLLLDAMRLAADSGLPLRLRLVGSGPERTALALQAQRLGLGDRVEFLGPLAPSAVQQVLAVSDALVLSSLMEGVPVVLMEAMAAGVPVLATRVGGVPELIDEGQTGLLVPPGSAEALAAGIRTLLADRPGAERRAAAARARIEADFNGSKCAESLLALFERYSVVPTPAR